MTQIYVPLSFYFLDTQVAGQPMLALQKVAREAVPHAIELLDKSAEILDVINLCNGRGNATSGTNNHQVVLTLSC